MEGEIIYVAVGKDVEDRNSTLKWALKKSKKANCPSICVFYVLVPAEMITLSNGCEPPLQSLKESEVESYRETEKQEADKILYDCGTMCNSYKVPFQTLQIQSESVTEGILELIGQLRVHKLVMGAAAKRTYWRRMSIPKSRKANYVLHNAPNFCHIWFVCNNHLIFTREGRASQLTENPEMYRLYSHSPESAGSSFSWSPSMNHGSSSTSTTPRNILDELSAQLQQVQKESKESTEKLHREVSDRKEAEKLASEANLKVQAAEKNLVETEKKLVETEKQLTDTKTQLDKALQELYDASSQLTSYKNQTRKRYLKVKEMNRRLEASGNSLKMSQNLCDSLQKKLNNALHVAQRSQQSLEVPISSCEYSLAGLEEATNRFDPSLKIGKGGYGDVYQGFLDHTDVAIKIPNPDSLQGPLEFTQEVDILTKLRHPNLVTLIGTCTKSRGLIYEYLPNGSLQDRLICKDNTLPLPWQTRIQIATELCSVLNFLHSRQPNSIIHTDVNSKNVLLDANFICKLSGFGSCHVMSHDEDGINGKKLVSPKTDVFSFGTILLSLLTSESNLVKVKHALDINDFYNILDHSAGQWPFVRATQLAHMALRCCHMFSDNRPDLASEVWMVLKPTNDPSRSLSKPLRLISEERIPPYFICPILQEIMHDPHFAADGYTYEANAIKTWFEGGHETSPMTNLRLASLHLTPNYALHSAIEEWQLKHQCV